ncbi:MAG: hypothetical protein GXY82_06365 [Methanospirillum sp.]|nr:hypothetical protein [Methanospirillum sp.]
MRLISLIRILLLVCGSVSTVMAVEPCPFVLKWGISGSGDGEFNYPSGIAVDGAGNVYVADTDNNRIQVFDAEGTFLRK